METKFCQSCGMPLTDAGHFGTNQDNTVNEEYCTYCYKQGAFTQNVTMDEMINHCAEFVGEFNKDAKQKMTKEEAIAQMKLHFPKLKRWTSA